MLVPLSGKWSVVRSWVAVSPAAPTSTIVSLAEALYGERTAFWPAPTAPTAAR